MKKMLFLLTPVVFLTACDTTTMQSMPRDPYVGRKVEALDGERGDVPGVRHPTLDPNSINIRQRNDGYNNSGYNHRGYRSRGYYY